ncbi:MAG TPA: glycoside hydrolase family 20 zincin-like fold domain-containing protein, partial [Prolixibacteraceae bacterium]|nr:glycoside hydrolase family 20 zincin-like fold domain-containing protein [Prolixibacteraceae bacterium]
MHFRLILCLLLMGIKSQSQEIIPLPNSYKQTAGDFKVPANLTISATGDTFAGLIPSFSASVKNLAGIEVKAIQKNSSILLVRDAAILGKEAYRLKIEPGKITIEAGTGAGCFYGLQSLLQLLHSTGKNRKIACGYISDQPRYEWRGLMLDESRHFFGEE